MFPADNFWCHPVWRSDHGVPLLVALHVCAEAEVGDLDAAVRAQQDVVGLDVAVQDPALVQVVHTFQNLKGRKK
jgi:hypothetical protein